MSSLQGERWAPYVKDVILTEASVFAEVVTERMLRAFDSLEEDAGRRANETTPEEAREWHINVDSCRWACLGLFAVGLFHLFEQHAGLLRSGRRSTESYATWRT